MVWKIGIKIQKPARMMTGYLSKFYDYFIIFAVQNHATVDRQF
jgi:hypothetical protein